MGPNLAERKHPIDRLVSDWQPKEIRHLATTLLRLAEMLDMEGRSEADHAVLPWPANLVWVERNATSLAAKARLIWEQRERRRQFISSDLLGEPAWDMLLDLFIQFAGGARVSTTSLCIASRVPATTALRYINLLEETGYAVRSQSDYDRRVTLVSLTERGVLAVGRYLEQY